MPGPHQGGHLKSWHSGAWGQTVVSLKPAWAMGQDHNSQNATWTKVEFLRQCLDSCNGYPIKMNLQDVRKIQRVFIWHPTPIPASVRRRTGGAGPQTNLCQSREAIQNRYVCVVFKSNLNLLFCWKKKRFFFIHEEVQTSWSCKQESENRHCSLPRASQLWVCCAPFWRSLTH